MTTGSRASSFSIIIPTYNRRETVCDCVRSLGALEYDGRIEIIVVVDGSTDGTAEALAQLNIGHPIQIIEQLNAGPAAARNAGAAAAGGDVLLFLDDDIIAQPALVAQHARMYCDGADAVIGQITLDPGSTKGFLADNFAGWLATSQTGSRITPFDVWAARLSVQRKIFEELGGFDETLTGKSAFAMEDADFGARLLARFQVRHNPLAIARHRYVVTPEEFMARAPRSAAGQLLFLRKHPEHTKELLEQSGWSKPAARFVYRPLSRVPIFPKLLSRFAVRLAERALKTRFRSNRIVARIFSVARDVVYCTAIREYGGMPDSHRLLILCYHAIRDICDDPVLAEFAVERKEFELQLTSLRNRGFAFVGPGAVAAFLAGAPLPRRAVLLTFDDCYPELIEIAREVLQPNGIGAVAFAVTGVSANEWDRSPGGAPVPLLTKPQLRELAALGVEIGCHSRTHRDLRSMSEAELTAEIAGAANDLMEAGLPRPRFFAYPYGLSDAGSRTAVRNAGFAGAMGLVQRHASRSSDGFDLPRIMILRRDRGLRFRLRTAFPQLFAHVRRRLAGV
jgi:glycosyltransferase involved in cell wall biosynthesis/peptidoglycan/xylan/chitin deacetylase (PgdA/CDA1 family)